jgi:hypothetical protein
MLRGLFVLAAAKEVGIVVVKTLIITCKIPVVQAGS